VTNDCGIVQNAQGAYALVLLHNGYGALSASKADARRMEDA